MKGLRKASLHPSKGREGNGNLYSRRGQNEEL